MVTKFVLPLVAAFGLGLAVYSVVQARQPTPTSRPLVEPPTRPQEMQVIAGAGLIEAMEENIPIGAPEPGVVTELFVSSNANDTSRKHYVQPGDKLFQVDDTVARAERDVRQARLEAARAELSRLEVAPREGDPPVARAMVDESRARLGEAQNEFERRTRLRQQNAITGSELDQAKFGYEVARAAVARSEGDLDRLLKTWKKDIESARVAVKQAEAELKASQDLLDRLTVRARTEGEVLQVNIRPGQFAALAWKEPLIVLGNVQRLNVRVDIDEQDVPLFRGGSMRAIATLKGRPQSRFDLDFLRVEPYVIPKKSLTGDNSERVDTRVLQVVYKLPENRPIPLFVGQQMDVYIEAGTPPEGVNLDADPAGSRPFQDPRP